MIDQVAEIVFNTRVTKNIFLIGLKSSHIARLARPGQFVMVQVRKGIDPLLRRPFSICGTRDKDLFLILYKVVGKGTTILSETRKGESISVLGPLGTAFEPSKSHKLSILVAGGMGVAPLYFLYQNINKKSVKFFAGFGSSDEIIKADRILDLKIESAIATDDGSEGHRGMVTGLLSDYLKQEEIKADFASLYACGPLPMLKTVSVMAAERKLPCYVSLETGMACGLGACQGCAVRAYSEEIKYLHVCKDGPVFHAQEIDWENVKV